MTSTSCKSWGVPTFNKETFSLTSSDGATIFETPYKAIENQSCTARAGDVILELAAGDEGCCEIRLNMRDGVTVEGALDDTNTPDKVFQVLKAKQVKGGKQELGELVVEFRDLPMLAPRGVFTLEIYAKHLRIHGKATKNAKTTLEWTVPMAAITDSGIYLLDDARSAENKWVCVSMSKPIKSGNQQYSCLVFEVPDVIDEVKLKTGSLTEEQKSQKTKDGEAMISDTMNGPLTETIPKCLKAISGARVITPMDVGPFQVSDNRARQGFIYCLKKSFLFAPSPAIPIRHERIGSIKFEDVHSGGNTVGITFKLTGDTAQSLVFQGLDRTDLPALTAYIKSKQLPLDGLVKKEEEVPSDLSSLEMSSEEEADDGGKRKRGKEKEKKSKRSKGQ